jgi:hypothetical protein
LFSSSRNVPIRWLVAAINWSISVSAGMNGVFWILVYFGGRALGGIRADVRKTIST